MKRNLLAVIWICIGIFTGFCQANPNPQQILAKAAARCSSAKGVEAHFKLSGTGFSGTGDIYTSGNKFYVRIRGMEVWFNGKTMYTYNKDTEETTVVYPTPEELSQSNPLAYVTGASSNYNVSFSTVKRADKYVLELTPKKKSFDIKRVTLTINKQNYSPEKIVIEPKGGSPVTAEITSFKEAGNLSSSLFEYPKSKYPKAEIIDLR